MSHGNDGISYHLYADDMQDYYGGRATDAVRIVSQLQNCNADVFNRYGAKRLHVHADKT